MCAHCRGPGRRVGGLAGETLTFSSLSSLLSVAADAPLSLLSARVMRVFDNSCNQTLTGTELPARRPRFSAGQEEPVQHRGCQDCQGTPRVAKLFLLALLSMCVCVCVSSPSHSCLSAGGDYCSGTDLSCGCAGCVCSYENNLNIRYIVGV